MGLRFTHGYFGPKHQTAGSERVSTERTILFLEQQSWRSGAQRVLDEVLRAIQPYFKPIVAFPGDGPFAAELRGRGIETVFFPLGRYRSGPKSLADMMAFGPRSVRCALRLRRLICQRNAVLVYINSPRCLVAGLLAARITGRPSVFHLHMTMTRRTDLWAASAAARHATKIIACSQTSAAALSRKNPRLGCIMQVIYNPVRKSAAANSEAASKLARSLALRTSSRRLVGLVGRITPQKGHHVLLRAAARLRSRGIDIHIAFVGAPEENNDGDARYVQLLKSSARQLGLEDRIHWMGYQDDPNPLYAVFDALAIPSTISEGLPMVALEALQWGLPIVGSGVGGIPEIVHDGKNGFLASPGDAEALADCLRRLLSSDEIRARLQAVALASIDERFSVETFRNQIRSALSEICSVPQNQPVRLDPGPVASL
ncbi:MAG: glycosyltransferase family 4 protein [Terriglobia bacterium]